MDRIIFKGSEISRIIDLEINSDVFLTVTQELETACWDLNIKAFSGKIIFIGNFKGEMNIKINIDILKENTHIEFTCLFLQTKDQIINLQSMQNHLVANSTSSFIVKNVQMDRSKFFYKSIIKIEPGSFGSRSDQQHLGLLLSDDIALKVEPCLEVKWDDVQCKHGSAVSALDKDNLWFLALRGLDYRVSEKILLNAFLLNMYNIDEYS